MAKPAWQAIIAAAEDPDVSIRRSRFPGLLLGLLLSRWTPISGDKRPDDVRLSDIEPCFTCQGCGRRGRMDATFLIGTRPLAEAKGSSCRSKNQGGDYRA